MKKESLNFKDVINHPNCQHGIHLLGIEKQEFYVYGGAVRDYILYKLGKTFSYSPNDFDILMPVDPAPFEEKLKQLIDDSVLTSPEEGKPPYFPMHGGSSFRVFWKDKSEEIQHIDIKCVKDKSIDEALLKNMFNIDSMTVDQNGKFHDPLNGFDGVLEENIEFNSHPSEFITQNPSTVFRYYMMCDRLNSNPTLGKDICKIAAPLISKRPFYEFNSALNSVMAKKNGINLFKKMFDDGLFQKLPFQKSLNIDLIDQVKFIEDTLSLKSMRQARVLAIFCDNKNQLRKSTNLEDRKKWEKTSETRSHVLRKIPEKHQEKIIMLELVDQIDQDKNLLLNLYNTAWVDMQLKEQLTVLLLSKTVFNALQENNKDIKTVINGYISAIQRDQKNDVFFKHTL